MVDANLSEGMRLEELSVRLCEVQASGKTVGVCKRKRGAETPREPLPIVSHLSADS